MCCDITVHLWQLEVEPHRPKIRTVRIYICNDVIIYAAVYFDFSQIDVKILHQIKTIFFAAIQTKAKILFKCFNGSGQIGITQIHTPLRVGQYFLQLLTIFTKIET